MASTEMTAQRRPHRDTVRVSHNWKVLRIHFDSQQLTEAIDASRVVKSKRISCATSEHNEVSTVSILSTEGTSSFLRISGKRRDDSTASTAQS